MKFFESLTPDEVIAYFREKAAGQIPYGQPVEYQQFIPDLAIGLIDVEFNYDKSLMPFSVRAARHYFDKEIQRREGQPLSRP